MKTRTQFQTENFDLTYIFFQLDAIRRIVARLRFQLERTMLNGIGSSFVFGRRVGDSRSSRRHRHQNGPIPPRQDSGGSEISSEYGPNKPPLIVTRILKI